MKFQLFGSKNVKTAEELRSVGRKKRVVRKYEDWGIDPVTALRTPIISSNRSSALTNSAVSSLHTPEQSVSKTPHLKLVSKVSTLRKKIGIYSSSKDYCLDLSKQLCKDELELVSFVTDSSDRKFCLEAANAIDAWLIHMTDQDESPWLECVLNLGANVASLFLFEENLTDQCLNKVQAFMLEAKQA